MVLQTRFHDWDMTREQQARRISRLPNQVRIQSDTAVDWKRYRRVSEDFEEGHVYSMKWHSKIITATLLPSLHPRPRLDRQDESLPHKANLSDTHAGRT